MLGDTPCLRIGRAPKRLLVYRAATPFAGRKRHPLELLARGQQFVAYAVHPDTGRPYEWPEDSLVELPLSRLPVWTGRLHGLPGRCLAAVPDEVQVNSIWRTPTSTWHGPATRRARGTPSPRRWPGCRMAAGQQWIPRGRYQSRDRRGGATSGSTVAAVRAGQSGRRHSRAALGLAAAAQRRRGKIYWLAGSAAGCRIRSDAERNCGPAGATASRGGLLRRSVAPLPITPPPKPYRSQCCKRTARCHVRGLRHGRVSPQPFTRSAPPSAWSAPSPAAGIARRLTAQQRLRHRHCRQRRRKDHTRRCAKRAVYAAGLDRYLGGGDLAPRRGCSPRCSAIRPAVQVDEFGQFLKLVLNQRARHKRPSGRNDEALHLGCRALHRRRYADRRRGRAS